MIRVRICQGLHERFYVSHCIIKGGYVKFSTRKKRAGNEGVVSCE